MMDEYDLGEESYLERSASDMLQSSGGKSLPLEYLQDPERVEGSSSDSEDDEEDRPLVDQGRQDGSDGPKKRKRWKKKKTKKSTRSKHEQKDRELLCGVRGWRPACLQPLANVYTFVTLVGLSYFMSGMANKSLHAQVVSIERQFNIDSSHSGLFGSAWHLGYSSTILLVGHFARITHIPFAIGLAGIVNGLLVMAPSFLELYAPYKLPQFEEDNSTSAAEEPHANQNFQYLCTLGAGETSTLDSVWSALNNSDVLENSTTWIQNATLASNTSHFTVEEDGARPKPLKDQEKQLKVKVKVGHEEVASYAYQLLLSSLLLQGAINSFRYGALPYVYVDDNVLDKTKTGTYLAVFFVFGELTGPAGDLINGVFSTIPVDLSDTKMSRKDPRFVSAWWLGFLVFGGMSILAAIPIMLLPRHLVPVERQRKALHKARVSFGGSRHAAPTAVAFKARTSEVTLANVAEDSENDESDAEYCQLEQKPKATKEEGAASNGRAETAEHCEDSDRRNPEAPAPSVLKPTDEKDTSLLGMMKDLPRSLLRIMKSPLYALLVLEMIIIYIPLSGIVWPFRVKYIMFEYNVTMAMTNTAKGMSSALTHIAGTLLGTLVSRRISTNMGYLRLILLTAFLSWLVTPLLIYFGCDNHSVVGLHGQLGQASADAESCDCDPTLNLLSCGSNGLTYLSPCHAGCQVSDSAVFTNCSGIGTSDQPGSVTPGICDVGCFRNFVIFNVLTATQTFIFSINNMPRHLLALRILEPKDRAFGSAFLHFAPFLVSLPAPYIFGKWMEQMCLVWSSDHCSLYDRNSIRYLMMGVEVFVAGLTVITYVAMVFICRHLDRKFRTSLQQQNRVKEHARSEDGVASDSTTDM